MTSPKIETHTCPRCGKRIEYEESQDLYDVVTIHLSSCPGQKALKALPNIVDLVPEEALKGNIITMEDIVEKTVLLKAMEWRKSTLKEDSQYLSLVIDLEGEEKIVNTGAERILSFFHYVEPTQLPAYVTFERIATSSGRKIYRVKGTT